MQHVAYTQHQHPPILTFTPHQPSQNSGGAHLASRQTVCYQLRECMQFSWQYTCCKRMSFHPVGTLRAIIHTLFTRAISMLCPCHHSTAGELMTSCSVSLTRFEVKLVPLSLVVAHGRPCLLKGCGRSFRHTHKWSNRS